jgi:hypothetical protein
MKNCDWRIDSEMDNETVLKKLREVLFDRYFDDVNMQATYNKLRFHLDMLLKKFDEQKK